MPAGTDARHTPLIRSASTSAHLSSKLSFVTLAAFSPPTLFQAKPSFSCESIPLRGIEPTRRVRIGCIQFLHEIFRLVQIESEGTTEFTECGDLLAHNILCFQSDMPNICIPVGKRRPPPRTKHPEPNLCQSYRYEPIGGIQQKQ